MSSLIYRNLGSSFFVNEHHPSLQLWGVAKLWVNEIFDMGRIARKGVLEELAAVPGEDKKLD